jgi:hypothetical protein
MNIYADTKIWVGLTYYDLGGDEFITELHVDNVMLFSSANSPEASRKNAETRYERLVEVRDKLAALGPLARKRRA